MDNMFKSKYPLTPELQNRSLASLNLSMYQLLSGSDQQKDLMHKLIKSIKTLHHSVEVSL